jgi:parvulin-like peptidyl-prolyl isomerase
MVEVPLVNSGHQQLKEDIEQMMRVQLRDMISQKVSADKLDAHIAAIDAKLDEATKALS